MPHLVRDWMSSPVIVVAPEMSVSYAMTLMRRRNIHSVLVEILHNQTLTYGIVTTTDIRDKIVGAGRNSAEVLIREIMSYPVTTGRPEWTLMECSQLMQKMHIHHLPIADESETLIGLISATDIFMSVEEQGWEEEG